MAVGLVFDLSPKSILLQWTQWSYNWNSEDYTSQTFLFITATALYFLWKEGTGGRLGGGGWWLRGTSLLLFAWGACPNHHSSASWLQHSAFSASLLLLRATGPHQAVSCLQRSASGCVCHTFSFAPQLWAGNYVLLLLMWFAFFPFASKPSNTRVANSYIKSPLFKSFCPLTGMVTYIRKKTWHLFFLIILNFYSQIQNSLPLERMRKRERDDWRT